MSDIITQLKNAEAAKREALAQLHGELGYPTAAALADAILRAAGKTPAAPASVKAKSADSKPALSTPSVSKATATKATSLGKGRRVPDAVRSQIAAALKAGETASKLPTKFGVSYNVIHEVKKKLGMVTARN